MQPINGSTPRPPGEPSSAQSVAGEQPLSTIQRTVLERLITRIVALSQQQSPEVWAGLKHDLGLKGETPLQSRHFPAAEQNLNQRLTTAQTSHSTRQIVQQLSDLLPHGNNRQAVSDYIRQQFGHSALSQLTPTQLKSVLTLLQNNQINIPQPPQRQMPGSLPAQHETNVSAQGPQRPTVERPLERLLDRPLQPVEHNALNQRVIKLTAATGESGKHIWQSMLELTGVKTGDLIPAKHFPLLTTWLQARQTLSQQSAPTLHTIQAALKQPLEPVELKDITDYSQQHFQATPQTVLTAAQVQDILHQVFIRRVERQQNMSELAELSEVPRARNIQPIYNPMIAPFMEQIKTISARPGLAFIAILVIMFLLWMVI